ncbi:hypothetical protein N431DRAFT_381805 [Stipitochalara longipes BDJ]|nr:hypothetical protein N431DRAFT_381805 [Stipitochalara longipes BDJ]
MTNVQESNKPQIIRSWSYGEVEVEEHADDSMTAKKYEDDAIVAVMGVTGAGKSSFISLLSGEDVKIGHDLESNTSEAQFFSFSHGSGSGYLIDTPGFDDTSRSNTDILKEVAACFCNMYAKGLKLNGIVYLHRISDPRMSGSAMKNLNMFQKLCGTQSSPNVVLVTTMWKELQQQTGGIAAGERREEELKTKDLFWAGMLNRGSKIMRHTGDRKSAQAILSSILDARTKVTLDIQTEMVDEGLQLDQTTAGKYLKQDYADLMHKYKVEAEEMQKSKLAAIDEKDKEMVAVMDEEMSKLTDEITKAKEADQNLKLNFRVLRDEKSWSFREPAAPNTSMDAEETASSSKETDADPRKIEELERSIQLLEQKHKAEMELLEEQHKSEISREGRMLRAKAKNVSAENEVLADLVRRLDQEREDLMNQMRRKKQGQEKLRKPDKAVPRKRPPPPPRPQDRGGSQDLALSAARSAWEFGRFVWNC